MRGEGVTRPLVQPVLPHLCALAGSSWIWDKSTILFCGLESQREPRGFVALEANPHHRRAQIVVLTDKGKRAFEAAMDLQAPWVNDLADGFLVREHRDRPPRRHDAPEEARELRPAAAEQPAA